MVMVIVLIMVDHKGEVVDGDELLFIIAKHGFCKGFLRGGVIGTMMSNLGLEIGLNKLGIDFKRTQVGDRYVIEALYANNWLLGEIFGAYCTFGDYDYGRWYYQCTTSVKCCL